MFVNDDHEGCSTPKLPLFSFPSNPGTPGLATPPVNVPGTVPFLWEEAPGKPRRSCDKEAEENGIVRCLELPPRMFLPGEGGKTAANEPSPTTVLDGPYVVGRRSLSLPRTTSFRKGKEKGLFGSTRWGNPKKSKEAIEGKFDFSRSAVDGCRGGYDRQGGGDGDGDGGGGIKVKISRVRRKGSLLHLNLFHAKSYLWARIYEGFKQVIPWRRHRQDNNLRRTSSSAT